MYFNKTRGTLFSVVYFVFFVVGWGFFEVEFLGLESRESVFGVVGGGKFQNNAEGGVGGVVLDVFGGFW